MRELELILELQREDLVFMDLGGLTESRCCEEDDPWSLVCVERREGVFLRGREIYLMFRGCFLLYELWVHAYLYCALNLRIG